MSPLPVIPEADLVALVGPIQTLFEAFHDTSRRPPEFPGGYHRTRTPHPPAGWMTEAVRTPTNVHIRGMEKYSQSSPEMLNQLRLDTWSAVGMKVRNLLKDLPIPYVSTNKLAQKHNEFAVVGHWNHAFGAPLETLFSVLHFRFPGVLPAGTSLAAFPEFFKAIPGSSQDGIKRKRLQPDEPKTYMAYVDRILTVVKPGVAPGILLHLDVSQSKKVISQQDSLWICFIRNSVLLD